LTKQETHAEGTSPECLICPLCQGIAALRQSRPEAMEHLFKAGVELLAAFRALVEPGEGNGQRATGIQRIDIG